MISPALYIHIPFCSSRCHYCNFYFETGWNERILRRTLEQSLEEFTRYYSVLGHPGISTIYFGGGTPSIIPPEIMGEYLNRLFGIIRRNHTVPRVMELDIEANPESLSREFLDQIAATCTEHCSTLRLSLGIQSFQPGVLRSLGRLSSPDDIHRSLDTASGFRDLAPLPFALNCDLIYGAGEQYPDNFQKDMNRLLAHEPDGISLYELTVEDRTPLAQAIAAGRKTVAGPARLDLLWEQALKTLSEHGYRNYEISNFAKPGKESKHNFAYWRLRPYIGIGPGAVSTIPLNSRPLRIENPHLFEYGRMDFNEDLLQRLQPQAKDHPQPPRPPERTAPPRPSETTESRITSGQNTAAGDRSGMRCHELTGNELFLEMFITGLRSIAGVSKTDLERIFGKRGTAAAADLIALWKDLLRPHPRRIILRDGARFTMDRMLRQITDYLEQHPPLSIKQWP